LNDAIARFEEREDAFFAREIREQANLFRTSVFKERISGFIDGLLDSRVA
jgi:hypothetical protein